MHYAFPGVDPSSLTINQYFEHLRLAHRITSAAYGEGYNDERTLRTMTNMAKVETACEDIPI